ncbi:MAG: DUF1080 domain-containing protein [Planctomycetia bacterium]|nr:DUF1080 domain-containing protein [Planctomycetia bacterium]
MVGCAVPGLADTDTFTMSLFNGRDLAGWHVTRCEAGVEDGLLVLKDGNGFVRTDHRYRDFVLELDWRARKTEKWDSGIYFRSELPGETGRPWPTRYQVNLAEGQEGNVKDLKGAASTGLVKPGEWNHFKLSVTGASAELEINGRPAWRAGSVEPADGYVGLQAEVPLGGQFEFRNITITEIGYRSLLAKDALAGEHWLWEGSDADAAKCWQIDGDELVCTGQPGPWLRSREQYGDFDVRLEYKLKPGGNSGVYLRVPRGGAHRGRELAGGPTGAEVQLLDDASERYRTIQPSQSSASIYKVVAASKHVSRPAGEWNTLGINCRGTTYRVTHNGVVVMDADAKTYPELADRMVRGYLGLQNHNEHVWFRNIRIGPAE